VSASKPAVPEPTRIGKYEVVQKLGAGAFGTVYKAVDQDLGRPVAIKTIRLEGLAASQASLEDLLARFRREAQVAAKLKHPNIVTIYEIGNAEGLSYISMEFVDGVGLDRVIAKSGRMSVERAAAIGAQVADALAYAQKHNVVHRDIKPANIMIEPGDHVKVTDFGIAKVTDSVDHLTATGSLLGTPSYMSPEQARGGKVDGRSDLFSVGCILYEMLAGQKAFRGESITALIFKIITEEPPSLRELEPTVTDEMLRIIGKALSKAPETRYQSGRELADDLLAVTRPGFVPTLRATDVPTLPPDTPPGDVPTIAAAPTVRPEATIGSAATAARPAATSSTQPAPATPPPLPPTVLAPPTTRTQAPSLPPRSAPPAPRSAQPLVAPAPARKGGGAGLLVGLGIAAVLAIAVVAGGGWYLFGRKPATAEPSPAPDVARATETPAPIVAASPTPAAPAEAAPTPAAATATPPPTVTGPHAGPRVASRTDTPAPPAQHPTAPPEPDAGPPPAAAAAGGDYSFLDEAPVETPDGRAAGEELAQKYRAGGSGGPSATRFSARPRWPRGLTRAEGPAVRTLLHIHSAEEAYHRKAGRYGNLREMATTDGFGLDVPFRPDGFQRARYRFHVTVEGDGYRVEAAPVAPIGRAFVVDDSGFVRLRDE
jgi:serine/threonine-protein kinase